MNMSARHPIFALWRWIMLACALTPAVAFAHPPDMSVAHVILRPAQIHVSLMLPWRELSGWVTAPAGGDYPATVLARMRQDVADLYEVRCDDAPLKPTSTAVRIDKPGEVQIELDYPPVRQAGTLAVRCCYFDRMPNTHQQAIYIEDERDGRKNILIWQDTLSANGDESLINLPHVAAGGAPTENAAPPPTPVRGAVHDPLAGLLPSGDLSLGIILLAAGAAFALGCVHAMSPGHGKTIVAAYLVGARGTARHALLLGIVVTATHVAGVMLLGLSVLLASRYVVPERIYPWLELASGLLVAAVGLWQLRIRLRTIARQRIKLQSAAFQPVVAMAPAGSFLLSAGGIHPNAHHHHDHDHPHHNGPGGHTHDMPERVTLGSLFALGVSGGIVPCPSALVLMLTSIAVNRTALGLALLVAFSLGLASILIAIGLLILYARRFSERFAWTARRVAWIGLASASIVTLLGFALAARALGSGIL